MNYKANKNKTKTNKQILTVGTLYWANHACYEGKLYLQSSTHVALLH